jgi:hypothetical protein
MIVGADVTLTNSSLDIQRTTRTDSEGIFIFSLLPPAERYSLSVDASGFKKTQLTGIVVRITETTAISTQLPIGVRTEEAFVQANSSEVEISNPTLGDTLGRQSLTFIPLLNRNFLQLLATDPAVVSDPGSTTLFVAGARSTSNDFVLNGIDGNNFRTNALTNNVPAPNPDALEEFRTQTSLYDATTGRNSGAAIAVLTRSGTDAVHGALYEYFRNNDLAANDFFVNMAGQKRPFFLRNQFGASLGGALPSFGHRLYLFGNYEGSRQRNATIESGFLPVLPGSRTAAGLASAFSLPVSAIDPVAVNILNHSGPYGGLLVPSGTGAAPGRLGTFNFAATSQLEQDQGSFRADRNFSLRGREHRVSLNVFAARSDVRTPISDPSLFFGQQRIGNGSQSSFANRVYSLSDTFVFSSNTINDFTIGLNQIHEDTNNHINEPTLASVGMSRFNQAKYPGLGQFFFTDQLGGIGTSTISGAIQHTSSFSLNDTLALNRGRHSLRFGPDFKYYQFNYAQPFGTRGTLVFSNAFADAFFGKPKGSDDLSFRDFLIGAPVSVSVDSTVGLQNFRAHDLGLFFEDDFRLTRRLTLNLGLRYDYMTPITDAHHRLGNFDPTLVPESARSVGGAGVLAGFIAPASFPGLGTPGVSESTLHDRNNHVSPRLGFGYDVLGNGKLAVRGGYGIYFDRFSALTPLQLSQQPPFTLGAQLSGFLGLDKLSNPFPVLPQDSQLPLLPTIPTLTGFAANGTPIFTSPLLKITSIDRNLRTPYLEHWNLSAEYQIASRWTIGLGYLGSHGVHLINDESSNDALLRNLNNPAAFGLSSNSATNRDARVPIVGFSAGGIQTVSSSAKSFYNAGIVEVGHRWNKGLLVKAAYTYSKSIDNDSPFSDLDIGNVVGNHYLPDLNKGPSDFDSTHRIVVTYVYSMPHISGRKGLLLGGWSLAGIATYQSGHPFSITQAIGNNSLSGSAGRAIVLGNCGMIASGDIQDHLSNYLNPACAAVTPVLGAGTTFGPLSPFEGPGTQFYVISPGGVGQLQGTSGRNIFRGPAESRADVAVIKRFHLPVLNEENGLEIRAEAFNVLNHPSFANPNGQIGSPAFGRITSTTVVPRQLQLVVRIQF